MPFCDVIVVGAGLAGLCAALEARRRGCRVRLVAAGAGMLPLSSGCVDLLGYVDGRPLSGSPFTAMHQLATDHPYRLLDPERIGRALDFLQAACAGQGLELRGAGRIMWIPSVVGTFKPSWLVQASLDPSGAEAARRVVVVGIRGVAEAQPGIVLDGFRHDPLFRDKEAAAHLLDPPWPAPGRGLTALDLARYVDAPEGRKWLCKGLRPLAGPETAILLPPVLGLRRNGTVLAALTRVLGCPVSELLGMPPNPGGMRMHAALTGALAALGVYLEENIRVTGVRVEGDRCRGLLTAGPAGPRELRAGAFILATGGLAGGGAQFGPDRARDAVLGLDLGAPGNPDAWSVNDPFAGQPYARLGVRVTSRLQPADREGNPLLRNVHVAGRALAGYDPVVEKSGNGVAAATGWYAARCVA